MSADITYGALNDPGVDSPDAARDVEADDTSLVADARVPNDWMSDAMFANAMGPARNHLIRSTLTRLIYNFNEPVRRNRLYAAATISVIINLILAATSKDTAIWFLFVTSVAYAMSCIIFGLAGGHHLSDLSCWLPFVLLVVRGVLIASIVVSAMRHRYDILGMNANMLVLMEYSVPLRDMYCSRNPRNVIIEEEA